MRSSQFFSACAAAVLCVLAVSAGNAEAQIYTWRDANGHLVLSDRPLSVDARTFSVPRALTVRATRPASAAYRNTYDRLIEEHAMREGLAPELVRAVVQIESAFNPFARSPKGAMGLMQLMPATAAQFGVVNPYSPADNLRGGVAYLRQLLAEYDGKIDLALAAYNAGPTVVARYGGIIPPYPETRAYVERVRRARGQTIDNRSSHRIYKIPETIGGRAVPRYSNVRPPTPDSGLVVDR